jgi:hypothetical protein
MTESPLPAKTAVPTGSDPMPGIGRVSPLLLFRMSIRLTRSDVPDVGSRQSKEDQIRADHLAFPAPSPVSWDGDCKPGGQSEYCWNEAFPMQSHPCVMYHDSGIVVRAR